MTGDYAVELFVRDAPMDREAVRFHISKDNYALTRSFRFTGDMVMAAKKHPDVFPQTFTFLTDVIDAADAAATCPHCGNNI